MKNTLHK